MQIIINWFWKVDSSFSLLVKMGCNESRCRSSAGSDKAKETVVYTHETEEFLKDVHEAKCFISSADCRSSVPPPVSRAVLDFAQRMSEDIVAQALQLCWEVESRYKEMPFIDAECDYIIWTHRSFLPGVWLHLDTKCVADEAGENARLSSEPLILEECSCSSQTFCSQLKNVFVISSHCKSFSQEYGDILHTTVISGGEMLFMKSPKMLLSNFQMNHSPEV